ncbi:MAG: hypothetical protein OIF32_04450 [Campylobacterales bacterium]|nr:hypothetical protein [Campylobacterales bacterium]
MVKTISEYPYSSSQKGLGVIKTVHLLSEYEPINTIKDYKKFYNRIKSITGRNDLSPKKAGRLKNKNN